MTQIIIMRKFLPEDRREVLEQAGTVDGERLVIDADDYERIMATGKHEPKRCQGCGD